jgi:hypothetical protein
VTTSFVVATIALVLLGACSRRANTRCAMVMMESLVLVVGVRMTLP